MRKLLAVISAVLLALLLAGGILAWRGSKLNLNFIQNLITSKPEQVPVDNLLPAIPKEEVNLSYDERIRKGDDYFERGFLTFASNEYVRAANLEPGRAEPYIKLVKTHLALRNYKKALTNAEVVLKLDSSQLDTRFDMVVIYVKLSDFETARSLLSQYPNSALPEPRVLYYQGLLDALYGNHDQAQKALKQASSTTNDSELNEKITTVLDAYQEFSYTQAAEELYRSELLARSFNKVGEYEMAIHLLKQVLRERGDLRDGWILLGFAYLNLEKYQFALTAFDKAYSLDAEWPTTQYFLGIAHKELGHYDDAINYFNLALSNDFEPKLVVYRHLADLYFETQDYENSAKTYERVLELNKDDVSSFIRPIWLYIDFVNEPERALKLAETAALSFPDSAMSYNLLGWSYVGLEDYEKAERNLKKAIEIDPNLAAAHFNLGNLYELQNRHNLAMESYQEAYSLDASGSIGNLAAKAYNDLLKQTLSD